MATEGKIIKEEQDDHNDKDEEKNNSNAVFHAQYLDQCILFDILTRIPADILQNNFKYQCRQWRSFLSEEYFIKANICQSKPGMIYIEGVGFDRYLLKYMELSRSEILRVCTLHEFKTLFTIKSSCNGLLLIREAYPSLYRIINPVTKKHTTFPAMRSNSWCELVFHGEYKVVELCDLYKVDGLERYNAYGPRCLRITTLNGKPSKHIQVPVNYDGKYRSSQVYISGVFYWRIDNHIVSFDLETEDFNIMQIPDICRHSWVGLINLFGSLSLVECPPNSSDRDVWSMVGGEWEKVFTLNGKQKFIGFLDDANLFFYDNLHSKLGAYDVKKKQHCVVDYSKYPRTWNDCFGHKVHVNSFLSLNNMV